MSTIRINDKQEVTNIVTGDMYLLERIQDGEIISYKTRVDTLRHDLINITGGNVTGVLTANQVKYTPANISYSSNLVVDFNGKPVQRLNLAGDVTVSTTNRVPAIGDPIKQVVLFLSGDNQNREVVMATGMKNLKQSPPFLVGSGAIAIVSLASFGPQETDTVFVFAEQP